MADGDRVRWDRRYAERPPPAGTDIALPPLFRPFADLFPTVGRAVEIACGTGEAAVWLAQRGLQVWACDVSPVAIARATHLAQDHAQTERCHFEVRDLDAGLPPGMPVDVLLCNMFRDPRLDNALVERLAAGGLLAASALSEVGASPGPFRAGPGELLRAFRGLQPIAADEADGRAWVLARKG